MNKVYGKKSGYAPVREDTSRIIASYDMEPVADPNYATWYEVYFYKKQKPSPTKDDIHAAIIDDINARTDERITHGFSYTIKHGAQQGTEVNVWLSKENQSDFHAMHQNADGLTFPVRYKVDEDTEGNPIYEEFADIEEIHAICQATAVHVLTCQQQGWKMKDSIDWNVYDV